VAAVIVLLIVAAGFAYYYYTASTALSDNSQSISSLTGQVLSQQSRIQSVESNLSTLQNLANARASLKITGWLAASDGTSSYQVKITNSNHFDVTLAQLTVNGLDNSGNIIASNTIAPRIVIAAGTSVSTTITLSSSSGSGGQTFSAIISTPYGQITL
jgi:hypothetical protein